MFSVVIPLYNKGDYILQCLASVYQQTCKDYEVIVINDGSGDNGAELVKSYYPQVKLITQQNAGVSAARNTGIAEAKGEYIAFLDADDSWDKDYLNKVATVISENPDAIIIGSNYSSDKSFLLQPSEVLSYYEISDYFKIAVKNTLFFTSATIVKREVIVSNKLLFNHNYRWGEDIDFWLRINMLQGKALYIKNVLVYYSKEDLNQATRDLGNLNETLVAHIATAYQSSYTHNPILKRFVNLYIYLTLYPYYYNAGYHKKAKEILNRVPQKLIWLQLPYCLPLSIGTQILTHPKLERLLRLYLKFFTRHFY